jgi:uncharacterized membrane protein
MSAVEVRQTMSAMSNDVLLYAGSTVLAVWGVAHLVPTRSVVRGFGEISADSTRIITMEWTAEGLTHLFVALLVVLVTAVAGADSSASVVVYRASAGFLVAIGLLTLATGARVPVIWFKLCPVVMATVATVFVVASFL